MRRLFEERLAAAGVPASPAQIDALAAFHRMLCAANARMNLTRVPDDPREAVDRNYIDSLSPLERLRGAATCVDVGSGAGFPGVPLAIFLPKTRFVLMDSLNKRVEFLRGAIAALSLNAEAVCLRAEDAGRGAYREAFDAATARAVAPLNALCELMLPLVRVGGMAVALKGPGAAAEAEEARGALNLLGGRLVSIEEARVPGRDWAHTLVLLEKTSPTPEKYPRRAGVPERRPL